MIHSNRLQTLPVSAVRKLAPYAEAAQAAGVEIYHLNIGDPDILAPEPMMQAIRAFDLNPVGYAPSHGLPAFLDSMVGYYERIGFPFVKSEHILATLGGSEAIGMALYGCCDTADEVLVFEPFYSNYHTLAALADVELRGVPTQIDDGFHLPDREVIEQHITPKTKAILISNPNNPTGTVYTKDELQMLVEIAVSHDLFLISDEVYREFSFTGSPRPRSILEFMPDHPDRLILTDSLSKRYNMCGARLGVLVTMNPDLFAGAYKIAQSRLSSGLVDQMAGAKQAEVPPSYLEETNAEYERRRDALYDGLSAIPGVTVPQSEGAFYTMAHLPVEDSEAFCIFMLEQYRSKDNKTVMLAPGSGFYLTPGKGRSEVRIAYVLSVPKITEAVEMIREGLEAFAAQA